LLRPVYDWLLRQAASAHAPFVLAAHAFVEAIFLPIPPDIMLAPMVLTRPERAWRYALICMIASVAGGCVSYAIGYYLAPVGVQLISLTGHHVDLTEYRRLFDRFGFWLILAKGFVPLPYLIITVAAGVAHFPMWQFILASLLTRGSRFFLAAFLVKRYGPAVMRQVEKNLALWGGLALVVIIALVVAIHFLFP
jgi:membrane protein YqaA with SNARE-associated domain